MSECDPGSPQPVSDSGLRYFDFLADMGFTKHFGSINATRELIDRCAIGEGKYVLDVGCGVGATPCYLAKEHGCRVVGVDITPKMVERAQERARRERVAHVVDFRVADARALPFEDNLFDAVICESVVVFVRDKQRAVDECARVTKPGGYVGLTETTLLKPSPSEEFLRYLSEAAGMVDAMLPVEAWAGFLRNAGLRDVVARSYPLDMRKEAKARFERYPMRDVLAAVGRLPRIYFRDRSSKQFLRQALGGAKYLTQDILEYMGYGIYVGQR